jgi:hypothetical protein
MTQQLDMFAKPAAPGYDHVWRWGRPFKGADPYEPQRKGLRCKVRCRGRGRGPLNVAVELEGGELVCAPRYAVRRAQEITPDRHPKASSSEQLPAKSQKTIATKGDFADQATYEPAPTTEGISYRSPAQELEAELRAQGCTVHPRQQHHGQPKLRGLPAQRRDPGRNEAAWDTVLGWFWGAKRQEASET